MGDLSAFLFVPALVGSIIVGFLVGTYASHVFLSVLQSTAAGSDETDWPDETLIEYLWKGVFFAWTLFVWMGPGLTVAAILSTGTGQSVWLSTGVFFWLVLPFALLSALSSNSVWLPFNPELFYRFSQRPIRVVQYYVFTAMVVAGCVGGLYLLFATGGSVGVGTLLLGPVLIAVTWLLLARLLGRLGYILTFTDDATPVPRKRRRPDRRRRRWDESPSGNASVNRPLDETVEHLEIQTVTSEVPVREPIDRTKTASEADDQDTGYRLSEPEPMATAITPDQTQPASPSSPRRRRRKKRRRDLIKEPDRFLNRGLLLTLFLPASVQRIFTLAIGLAVLGLIGFVAVEFTPQ